MLVEASQFFLHVTVEFLLLPFSLLNQEPEVHILCGILLFYNPCITNEFKVLSE